MLGTVLRWASDVTVLWLNTGITTNTIYRSKPSLLAMKCLAAFMAGVIVLR